MLDACSSFSENAIPKTLQQSIANVSNARAWVARSWTGSTELLDNQPLLWEHRRHVNPRIHAIGSEGHEHDEIRCDERTIV
jgi:hypothetical protein